MERVDALTTEVRALRQQIAPDGGLSLSDRIEHLTEVVDHQVSVIDQRTSWWRAAVAVGVVVVLAVTSGAFLLELRTRSEIADGTGSCAPWSRCSSRTLAGGSRPPSTGGSSPIRRGCCTPPTDARRGARDG
jgi:hypothetical protein